MLAVNQENEQLMEDYEKLASDVGTLGVLLDVLSLEICPSTFFLWAQPT